MLNDFYQTLNPVAFSIGPVSVRWYGLAYLFGFIVAYFIARAVIRHWKLDITDDDLLTFIVSAALGIIIGARLGYCLFYGDGYYLENPLQIFALSNGGMSFHGGLVGAIIGAIIAARIIRVPIMTIFDLGSIGAPVGLFFGRCANFINGELWGAPTDLPWGVVFSTTGGGNVARHPSQLYEAILEGLVILIILLLLARKSDPPRPRGSFFGTFLVFYGIFRICIEFVRVPDAQLGYLFGTSWVTMGMCLSVPVILAGIIIVILAYRIDAPQEGRHRKADKTVHSGGEH